MADTPAMRMRRHRAHAKGDHSLCKGCAAQTAAEGLDGPPLAAGGVAAAVKVFVSQFRWADTDPRALMGAIAIRLAEGLDQAPSPGLAHELGALLSGIGDHAGPADDLDELRLRRYARRLDIFIDQQGRPRDVGS